MKLIAIDRRNGTMLYQSSSRDRLIKRLADEDFKPNDINIIQVHSIDRTMQAIELPLNEYSVERIERFWR